jgi:hypothetical protein
MQRIATCLALAASLLLAGCFGSQHPVFPLSSAVRALGDGGRYETFERVDGKDKPAGQVTVKPRADGAYDFVNDKGASNPVSLHPIEGGLHVAQIKLDGDSGYGYVMMRITGDEGLIVPAECDRQDQAKMKELGVEIKGRFECRIDNVKDPAAFFAGLVKGDPISKMVRMK